MTLTLDRFSLKESPELLNFFLKLMREDINFLRSTYPNFEEWLNTKVLPGLTKGERTIIVEARQNHPIGLLILKHTEEERKLCTLRVRPEFEYRGVGIRLFSTAFDILETTRPLLSVSETALPKFARIFEYFAFSREAAYKDLYQPRVQELSYNGLLKTNKPKFDTLFAADTSPTQRMQRPPDLKARFIFT